MYRTYCYPPVPHHVMACVVPPIYGTMVHYAIVVTTRNVISYKNLYKLNFSSFSVCNFMYVPSSSRRRSNGMAWRTTVGTLYFFILSIPCVPCSIQPHRTPHTHEKYNIKKPKQRCRKTYPQCQLIYLYTTLLYPQITLADVRCNAA